MENKRPTLKDPAEYALIKSVYFKDNRKEWEDLDPIERLERQESRHRSNNKSSR